MILGNGPVYSAGPTSAACAGGRLLRTSPCVRGNMALIGQNQRTRAGDVSRHGGSLQLTYGLTCDLTRSPRWFCPAGPNVQLTAASASAKIRCPTSPRRVPSVRARSQPGARARYRRRRGSRAHNESRARGAASACEILTRRGLYAFTARDTSNACSISAWLGISAIFSCGVF